MATLTNGAITQICMNGNGAVSNPVVQVLETKQVESKNPNAATRYRMVISDGSFFQQSMIGSQLNAMVADGVVKRFSVVRLTDFICNEVNGKKIVIILGMEHLHDAPNVIGTPANLNEKRAGAGAAPAPSQPQQQQQQQRGFATAQAAPPQAMNGGGGGAYNAAMRGGGAGMAQANHNTVPISAVTMYSPRWTIKARVTAKSDFRTWVNDRGAGKLFSVDLLDEHGGEIRATMFNDDADRFHPILQVGHVYFISKGSVKFANKRFNTLSHEYEITLNATSMVEECQDDTQIAKVKWSFVPLESLARTNVDSVVDIIGVLSDDAGISEITTKKGDQITKRDITVVDNSDGARQVRITLWRDKATDFNPGETPNPVIAIKSLRVGDFGGKSLSSLQSTHIVFHPVDVPEAVQLRSWFDGEVSSGGGVSARPIIEGAGGSGGGGSFGAAPFKTFSQISEEGLGVEGAPPSNFMTRASVSMINSSGMNWYPACPGEGCNKKVVEEGSGQWHCEKCQKAYPAPVYRYILNIGADDHTGMQYLTAFNDVGEKIMGEPAGNLEELKQNDIDALEEKFSKILMRKYNFRIRARTEMYQHEPKLRCTIVDAEPVDYVADTTKLIAEIKAM